MPRSFDLMLNCDVLVFLERAIKKSGEVLFAKVKLLGHLAEEFLAHRLAALGNGYADAFFAIQHVPASEVLPIGFEFYLKLRLARLQDIVCLIVKPHSSANPSTG